MNNAVPTTMLKLMGIRISITGREVIMLCVIDKTPVMQQKTAIITKVTFCRLSLGESVFKVLTLSK